MADDINQINPPADDANLRRRLMAELARNDSWLRTLVADSPVGISVSLNGCTLFGNRAYLRLFGCETLEDVIDTPQLSRVAPESRETVADFIRRHARGEAVPGSYEIMGLRRDGTCIPLYVEAAPVRLMGRPLTVLFFADFTDKKKMEEALRSSMIRFRSLVESIDNVICETDLGLRFTYISPRVYDLFGYRPEEVLGASPLDFMEPAEAERVSKLFIPGMKKAEKLHMALTLLRRDGTRVYVEVSGCPFFDGNGKHQGYRSIARDITSRRRAREALVAAEKKYRNIVENAVEGIFQTSPDGRFLDVNPAMARILGYGSAEELKDAVWNIGRQIYRDSGVRAEIMLTLDEKGFGSFAFQVSRKDGTEGWIFINVRVVRDGEGRTLYYEGFAKDITERKRLEEELRRAKDELEQRVVERTEELNRRSAKLEDLNVTLRTILEQRSQDGALFEQQVRSSVNKLVKPLLQTLRKTRNEDERETLLNMIEASLDEVVSPLSSQMAGERVRLTRTEMQVAHFICQGMRSKEVADLLKLSKGTIDFHRNNIRRKLGLKDRKTSLCSQLMHLSEKI